MGETCPEPACGWQARLGKFTPYLLRGVQSLSRIYFGEEELGIDIVHLLLKDKSPDRIKSLGEVIDQKQQDVSKGYDLEL